jgi:FkbM family methyltransferase
MLKINHKSNSYFKISDEVDITQVGILSYLERLSRSHPYIYYFARKIAFHLNIFEREFDGIKKIKFTQKKINLIDVGASDGIAIKYINKLKPLNYIYAFEPNKLYYKQLINLKNKFQNLTTYCFGLSEKKKEHIVYIPCFKFLGKFYYMITYTFYNLNELKNNLRINFTFKNNISIRKFKIKLDRFNFFDQKIDLVKLDVNGHEFSVIKGLKKLLLKDKPALILEELENIDKIELFLKKYKYKCYYYDVNKKKLVKKENKKHKNLNFYFLQKKHLN